MRITILFFSTVLLLVFSSCKPQEPKNEDYIKLFYVDLEDETPIDVSCDSFEIFFRNSIDSVTIKDENTLNLIVKELDSLQPIDTNYSASADTRIKLYINRKQSESIIVCMDNLVVEYKNKTYKNTDNLKKVLLKLEKYK